MSKTLIVTTRKLDEGFLNAKNCERCEAPISSQLARSLVNDAFIRRWLKELPGIDAGTSCAELLEQYGDDICHFVLHKLNMKCTVEGLTPLTYYKAQMGDTRVIGLPHLWSGFNQNERDNQRWVAALLATFAPDDGEPVCLVLHDKDLYGHTHAPLDILSGEETGRLTRQRRNTSIVVFQHNGGPVDMALSQPDLAEGVSQLIRQTSELGVSYERMELEDEIL